MDSILRSVQCTIKRQVGPFDSLDMKCTSLSNKLDPLLSPQTLTSYQHFLCSYVIILTLVYYVNVILKHSFSLLKALK